MAWIESSAKAIIVTELELPLLELSLFESTHRSKPKFICCIPSNNY